MNLENLLAECTAYDFKLMLEENKPKSWLKSVSAFANGLGGSLFLALAMMGLLEVLMMCNMFVKPSALKSVIIWTPFLRLK